MEKANPKEEINPNDKNANHAHFQVLNKTKSTFNKSNLFLNLNPQIIAYNTNKETPNEDNKKDSAFGATIMSPQKKSPPEIYQTCEGDTLESIASKFNISVNWLIRQNMKQILNPNFSLSKSIQFNVTAPSSSMIKPLDCSVVRNKHQSDSEGNAFTNDPGEPGIAYISVYENAFDFVPLCVDAIHRPIRIKLASINEDVIVFTPKAHRDKLQKQKPKQLDPSKPTEIFKERNYQNISELASAIADHLIENSLKVNSDKMPNPTENNTEQINIEKPEKSSNTENIISEQIAMEKLDETSKQIEKNEQTNETIKENQPNIESPASLNSSPQNPQEAKANTEMTEQKDDKDSILVVSFKTKAKDQIQIDTLYFRVRKEEGNRFSVLLQRSIKDVKSRLKSKRPAKIPIPQTPPSTPPPHIANSASSPLSFFQSIFTSIKDTFSHLNDNDTPNDNNNNNTPPKPTSTPKSTLYRRSFSEKTISNSLGRPLFSPINKVGEGNEKAKDDSLKPRRYSQNSEIPSSSQQKRKVLAASVLLQIKIIDGPSAIFEKNEEIDEIRSKLPYRMRSYDWMLIYRLSRDGSSFTNFFNYTRNSGPIVFIMSTSTKERIGAFIPTGFKYSSKYYGSGEAFVFRLVKQKKEKEEEKDKSKDKNEKEENNEEKEDNNEEKEDNNKEKEDNNEEKEDNNKEKEDNNEEKEDQNVEKEDNNEEKEDQSVEKEEKNVEKEDNIESEIDYNEKDSNKTDNVEKDDNINQIENEEANNEKVEKSEVKKESNSNEDSTANSFAHIEAFKWTPGTNTNFMMSEKDTIIIGIGDGKDSSNQEDIDAIHSSHGHMSGPAIWIGQDLQYASSSPCSTFSSPQLTKKNYFYVDDIEIWKIGFFSKK